MTLDPLGFPFVIDPFPFHEQLLISCLLLWSAEPLESIAKQKCGFAPYLWLSRLSLFKPSLGMVLDLVRACFAPLWRCLVHPWSSHNNFS